MVERNGFDAEVRAGKAVVFQDRVRFLMRGVTPGDYKLFAWEALENSDYFDPDVLRRSEAQGKALASGSRQSFP